jgi:hypothetical protein
MATKVLHSEQVWPASLPPVPTVPDQASMAMGPFDDCLPERGYRVPDELIVEPAAPRRRSYRPRRPVYDEPSVDGEAVTGGNSTSDGLKLPASSSAPTTDGGVEEADGLAVIRTLTAGDPAEVGSVPTELDGAHTPPALDRPRDADSAVQVQAPWRDGGRGASRRRGRGGPVPAFDGRSPVRRDGQPMGVVPAPPRGPNSVSAVPARPMRGVPTPYASSLGRMSTPGDASSGFRSIGRSPEDVARLAQEARREARLNRGRMFRAAAVGQAEPYRALGRGTSTPPTSGVTGNGLGRSGNGPSRPQSRPGASRTGRP